MPSSLPIFIVGPGRSGTTLLRLMLNKHSRIVITPESPFVYRLYRFLKKKGDPDLDSNYEFLWSKIRKSPSFVDFKLNISDNRFYSAILEIPKEKRTLSKFILALYEVHMRDNCKNRWGNKTPRFAMHLDILENLFPNTFIIGMIRDCRAVTLSYLESHHLETNPRKIIPSMPIINTQTGGKLRLSIISFASRWAESIRPFQRTSKVLKSSIFIEAHYEKLLTDPQGELERICRLIGEKFDLNMLDYYKDANDWIPRSKRSLHANVCLPVDTKRISRWQEKLSPAEIFSIEMLFKDELTKYGYTILSPSLNSGDIYRIKEVLREHFPILYDESTNRKQQGTLPL